MFASMHVVVLRPSVSSTYFLYGLVRPKMLKRGNVVGKRDLDYFPSLPETPLDTGCVAGYPRCTIPRYETQGVRFGKDGTGSQRRTSKVIRFPDTKKRRQRSSKSGRGGGHVLQLLAAKKDGGHDVVAAYHILVMQLWHRRYFSITSSSSSLEHGARTHAPISEHLVFGLRIARYSIWCERGRL